MPMNRIIRGQMHPVGSYSGRETRVIDRQISALMPRLKVRRHLSAKPPTAALPRAHEKDIKTRASSTWPFASDIGLLELIDMISDTLHTKKTDANGRDEVRSIDGLIAQIVRDRHEAELALDAEIVELERRIHLLKEEKEALAVRVEDLTHGKLAAERRADALQKLVEDIRTKNIDLNKERNYYESRMHQEKELSRQLLVQNEALRAVSHPPSNIDDAHQEEREEREESVSRLQQEACVVCREICAHYENIPCDHPICTECFVHWYASLMNYNDTRYEGEAQAIFSCPMCRTPIDVDGSCESDSELIE